MHSWVIYFLELIVSSIFFVQVLIQFEIWYMATIFFRGEGGGGVIKPFLCFGKLLLFLSFTNCDKGNLNL